MTKSHWFKQTERDLLDTGKVSSKWFFSWRLICNGPYTHIIYVQITWALFRYNSVKSFAMKSLSFICYFMTFQKVTDEEFCFKKVTKKRKSSYDFVVTAWFWEWISLGLNPGPKSLLLYQLSYGVSNVWFVAAKLKKYFSYLRNSPYFCAIV